MFEESVAVGCRRNSEEMDETPMTEKLPFFSIIIPVYNIKKYLHQCIRSILEQTYKDYEILLIDDGSSDGSDLICDNYAAEYQWIHAYHQKNQGPMKARIEGIRKARGEYCLFIDSDDYVIATLLEEVYKYLQIDDLELLIFNKVITYQNKKYKNSFGDKLYRKVSRKEALSKFMASNEYTAIYTKVIKTTLLLPYLNKMCVPFDYAEDALLTAYFILLSDRIGILDKCLYHYRIRRDSLIHHKTVKRMQDMLSAKKMIYDLVASAGYLTEENKWSYYGNTLNDFMDGIFRIDNIDRSISNRKKDLEELSGISFAKKLLENKDNVHVTGYNRIRVNLLSSNKYAALIILDHILMPVRRMTDLLRNRKKFD